MQVIKFDRKKNDSHTSQVVIERLRSLLQFGQTANFNSIM